MKEIKGEKYYVSLGYVEDNVKDFNIRDIKSLEMEGKDNKVYLDDTDKNNIVTLPLMPVNEIVKNDDKFIFRFLLDPYKTKWVTDDLTLFKINVLGLFAVMKENSIESIRNINFYELKTYYFDSKEQIKTIEIESKESDIIGE